LHEHFLRTVGTRDIKSALMLTGCFLQAFPIFASIKAQRHRLLLVDFVMILTFVFFFFMGMWLDCMRSHLLNAFSRERENAGLNITCASRVFLLESVVHHGFEIQGWKIFRLCIGMC
jgi:hypothetical protein